ncbi:MAG: hypothetical protein IIB55_05145 [Planctomycetes bacterium]|nr:hypothetical protein [Planctomycetota bacterium]MCH9057999.1 hypothetical protein [Planctomycetota bacterium]
MAAGVVDDRESAVDERDIDNRAVGSDRAVAESPVPVRTAVLDRLIDDVKPRLGDGPFGREHPP